VVWSKAYFDIFSRLGMTYECDERTDGQRDRRSDTRTNIPI